MRTVILDMSVSAFIYRHLLVYSLRGCFNRLPAAGYVYYNSGWIVDNDAGWRPGERGNYWSSTGNNANNAYNLNFNSGNVNPANNNNRHNGNSVRLVQHQSQVKLTFFVSTSPVEDSSYFGERLRLM